MSIRSVVLLSEVTHLTFEVLDYLSLVTGDEGSMLESKAFQVTQVDAYLV